MLEQVKREKILNLDVDCVTQGEVLSWVLDHQSGDRFRYVVTPNAYHYVSAYDSPIIANTYHEAALCINDSRVVAILLRPLGKAITVVTGSDLTERIFAELQQRGGHLSLIGMRANHLPKLRAKYPNITIRHLDPPNPFFDDPKTRDPVVEWIESQPDGLFIFAVGNPQQERLAQLIFRRGKVRGVGLCIGASVDFLVGAQKRAPKIYQMLHLEWLYRLASDPRRMWRRYLVTSPRFFAYAMQETLGFGRNHDRSPARSNDG